MNLDLISVKFILLVADPDGVNPVFACSISCSLFLEISGYASSFLAYTPPFRKS